MTEAVPLPGRCGEAWSAAASSCTLAPCGCLPQGQYSSVPLEAMTTTLAILLGRSLYQTLKTHEETNAVLS